MPEQAALRDQIKRKVRKLKKAEIKIRFEQNGYACSKAMYDRLRQTTLVWDQFFDLADKASKKGSARYTLDDLVAMDHEKYKEVVSAYFWQVYFQFYKDNGIMNAHLYDPDVLAQLGLPYNADEKAIKKRFRELAMQHHPDRGGDSARFNQLMEQYRKLGRK